MLKKGTSYSKQEIYELLDVPEPQQGGKWATGYCHHEGRNFIFANVGSAGRTGHDYTNYWSGDDLHWEGKRGAKASHASIRRMTDGSEPVLLFTREADRDPWTFQGVVFAAEVDSEAVPVRVRWRLSDDRGGGHAIGDIAEFIRDETGLDILTKDVRFYFHSGADNWLYVRHVLDGDHRDIHEPVRGAGARNERIWLEMIKLPGRDREYAFTGAFVIGGVTEHEWNPSWVRIRTQPLRQFDRFKFRLVARYREQPHVLAPPKPESVIKAADFFEVPDVRPEARAWLAEHAPVSHYAVIATPNVYDIESAIKELQTDSWGLKSGSPKPGDKLVIWRADGGTGYRGVVALAEVLTEILVDDQRTAPSKFFVGENTAASRRFRLRYIVPDGLPLWLGDDPDIDEVLNDLTVSRGQGTKLFHVAPKQWNRLEGLLGDVATGSTFVDVLSLLMKVRDVVRGGRTQVIRFAGFGERGGDRCAVFESLTSDDGLVYRLNLETLETLVQAEVSEPGTLASARSYEVVTRVLDAAGVTEPSGLSQDDSTYVVVAQHLAKLLGEDGREAASSGGWVSVARVVARTQDSAEDDRLIREAVRTGSQGFSSDPRVRKATELRAMDAAREWLIGEGFSEGQIEDTSANNPFDFRARRKSEVLYVEVKGTSGAGESVMVTAGEVKWAREHPGECALIVVSGIEVTEGRGGGLIGIGGTTRVEQPWVPSDEELEPLSYSYAVQLGHRNT